MMKIFKRKKKEKTHGENGWNQNHFTQSMCVCGLWGHHAWQRIKISQFFFSHIFIFMWVSYFLAFFFIVRCCWTYIMDVCAWSQSWIIVVGQATRNELTYMFNAHAKHKLNERLIYSHAHTRTPSNERTKQKKNTRKKVKPISRTNAK